MRHEDEDGNDVETTPHWVFQHLVFIQKDVSNENCWDILVVGPEESQRNQPTWPPVNKRGWRSQEVLRSVSKTELEEMNGHEREQHQTCDGQIQLATHQSRRQFLVPRSLQTNKDVLNNTYSSTMFAWKPNPVQYRRT